MTAAASLSSVSKTYPNKVKALRDVSFTLNSEECTVLLGPNGAGKTTFIKILTGILRPDKGDVRSPARRRFGVALQEIGLWPHLTLYENLLFAGQLYRINGRTLKQKSEEILGELNLEPFSQLRFDELSEGLKRRLNLACALIHEPDILVLDEPSLGLDVQARRSLWKYLEHLIADKQITLLLSTHDMEEAERLSKRIGILDSGRLMALDSSADLKQKAGRGDEITFRFSPPQALSEKVFSTLPGFVSGSAANGVAHFYLRDGISRIPGMVTSLQTVGITIEDVQVKPAALADAFLTLTGHSLD